MQLRSVVVAPLEGLSENLSFNIHKFHQDATYQHWQSWEGSFPWSRGWHGADAHGHSHLELAAG